MSNFQVINLFSVEDSRGILTVVQNALPFEVARTFWISGADGQTRGGHRHHVTRQALIAVSGEVEVYMNDGQHSEVVLLDSSSKCLIVEAEDWHTMSFDKNAVLLVFASHLFDAADYIDSPYSAENLK